MQLAVRFLLEVAALIAVAGHVLGSVPGAMRIPAACAAVVIAATAWAMFRVPGDPGPAPIAVSGAVRLGVELVLLVGPALLVTSSSPRLGTAWLVTITVHYATSGRIGWLLAR